MGCSLSVHRSQGKALPSPPVQKARQSQRRSLSLFFSVVATLCAPATPIGIFGNLYRASRSVQTGNRPLWQLANTSSASHGPFAERAKDQVKRGQKNPEVWQTSGAFLVRSAL